MRLAAFATLFLFASLAGALAQTPAEIDSWRPVFNRIDQNSAAAERYRTCPANVFSTIAPFWLGAVEALEVDAEECSKNPTSCSAGCFDGRNHEACFAAALAVQQTFSEKYSRYYETLFSEACATGQPAGCTNRAAGIRNGGYDDDPFAKKDEHIVDGCLLRSFTVSCDQGDAWGCAMLGQAHYLGEGTEADPAGAQKYFEKACAIEPDFSACDFGLDYPAPG